MTTYFDYYGVLSLQRFMVSDRRRTDAFAKAIQEVVAPGDHVLDVGTGTGILAMLAAKAGATRLHAIDQARVTEAARLLVAHNGLSDRITVLDGNAAELTLPEPVDVLISEWLGQMAFEENMLSDVIKARDKNLKPGGKMLPSDVTVLLAPLSSLDLYEEYGPGFWQEPIHGLDLQPLETIELGQARPHRIYIPSEALLAPGLPMVSLNLRDASAEDPWKRGKISFIAARTSTFHGFGGWFNAQLSPSVSLDTGPDHPETHWLQTYFPFRPTEVKEGEVIEVEYEISRIDYAPRGIEVALRTRDQNLRFALD